MPTSSKISDLLTSDQRSELERIGRPRSFAAGTVLMDRGRPPEGLFIVTRGIVKITWITPEGAELVLGFCGDGEVIGELSIIDPEPRSGTATAVNAVEALFVPAPAFMAFIEGNAGVAMAMLRMLSRRFRDSDRRLIEFGSATALGRVSSRLLELGERWGEPTEHGLVIALPLSQDELAGWAGCSRKAVVNALQTLRRLGSVETDRRRITITDPVALRRTAASL